MQLASPQEVLSLALTLTLTLALTLALTLTLSLTEGRRAQMRCQMVQTEGATLAESRRVHAAFMIQRALIRAAIRQRAPLPQRAADSGTPSRPPEQRPTDAGDPADAGDHTDAGASSSGPPVQPGGHP